MKIWTYGSSPRSGSRNAWRRIKNINGVSRLSNYCNFFGARTKWFLSGAIVDHGRTWLYHYDPETKQQSMEWRHSLSHRPKNSECRNSLEKFSPRFFEIKMASYHSLPSKGPHYHLGVLLISAGATERHFEGKTPRKVNKGVLVLVWQCPGSAGTCIPEEIGLPRLWVSWSPTLFSGSGTVGLPSFPWTE